MKRNLLLIIALTSCINLSAQTEFMPIGSTVRAKFYSFAIRDKISIFHAEKDTIVDGIVCRKVQYLVTDTITKLSVGFDALLFKQKNDSIFEYTLYNKKLNFLFKNKYSVGDSFKLEAINGNKINTLATVFVDSVIASNGVKRYACRLFCHNQMPATNRFFRFNLYDKFIPDLNWYLAIICRASFDDAVFLHYPLSYIDKTTCYKTPLNTEGKCNPFSPIAEMDYGAKIFPNPADSYISVLTNQEQNVRLIIRNIQGKEVFRTTLLTPKNLEINHLPDGFYIISVENEQGRLTSQKLIVHH
jgi:Secretion system C-terminal sorting domain